MPSPIFIVGAGGVGREIAATLRKSEFDDFIVKGFIDNNLEPGSIINSLKVSGNIEWLIKEEGNCGVIIAIGNPQVRKEIIEKLKKHNFSYPTIIHPNVSIHDTDTVKIGSGCYIADGCILTTDIIIEDFCFINTSCSLQHDTFVGSNTVIMPGVRITGGAKIGSNTYIYANCVITTPAKIDDDSIIKNSIR